MGLFVAPVAQSIFEVELDAVERTLERLTPNQILGGVLGLIAGLLVAFLIKSVLFEFIASAGVAGSYVADVVYIVLSLFAAYLGAPRRREAAARRRRGARRRRALAGVAKLIDTSVIVDGRILEIVESGFLKVRSCCRASCLRELQLIADSADSMKRTRGRRGLDVLAKLQESTTLEIVDQDYHDLAGRRCEARAHGRANAARSS